MSFYSYPLYFLKLVDNKLMINRRIFFKKSILIASAALIDKDSFAHDSVNANFDESLKPLCKNKELSKPYRGWKKGEMDIHHIYTGRGESSFLIFPDATTMLIDAGDYDPLNSTEMLEQLPDSSKRAGEWITRYLQRVIPIRNNNTIDYLMVSHFHNDHTGDTTIPGLKRKSGDADYILCGITEVGETFRFNHVFDRGWPDYNYPLPITDPDVLNFRKFVNFQKKHYGTKQEKFKVGALDQIKLLRNPKAYKNRFSIRNISANAEIWQGKGMQTVHYYDLNSKNLEGWQNENIQSLSIRIDYGNFSYFTGGDLGTTVLDEKENKINIEEIAGLACGPVDVCKANHHGYLDSMTEGFIRNVKAHDYIFPVWDYEHIKPEVIKRIVSSDIYGGRRNLYFTNLPKELIEKYKMNKWFSAVSQEAGHVIVKVFDSGKKYKIYVIGANDEEMLVNAVYGPFNC